MKERATDIKGKSRKVERYEYKSRLECGHPLVAMDPFRGERVCECGMTNKRVMMTADTELKWQGSKDPLRNNKDSLTYDEIQVLNHIRTHDKQEGFTTGAKIEDANVLQVYEKISGYDPNDPNTDVGVNLRDVLSYWKNTGVKDKMECYIK